MKTNYKLNGIVVPVEVKILSEANIDNFRNDKLGQAVLTKFNRKFKGVDNIEYSKLPEQGRPLAYSNVPRALGLNQALLEETAGEIRVLNSAEVVRFWKDLPERDATYADTNSITIYPAQGPNEELRQKALAIVGKDSAKLEVPLIIENLGVEKADNDYGFTFIETDYTTTESAPWLKQDGYIKHNGKKVVSCSPDDEGAVRIVVPSDQSGLRGLYRGGSYGLDARCVDLVYSGECGRVQIIQSPQCTKNSDLEQKLQTELKQEKDAQMKELTQRYEKALKVLRGEE